MKQLIPQFALLFLIIVNGASADAQDLRLILPIGHTEDLNSAQFSPDGKTIVTASFDNTAKVWDATTGMELLALEGHSSWVYSVQFSPDGKTIVTASNDTTAKVWDATTGKELQALKGHSDNVTLAQFSPDGKTIVTASDDKTAKVWDATTGKELYALEGHSNGVNSAQFSPDGKTIVTASDDKTAKVWDANTGKEIFALEGHLYPVNSAQFSPDGKTIVTASNDNTAKVWDANTGQELLVLKGHSSLVNSAKFSPDGKTIVTASWDKTAKVWDANTGQEIFALEGHSNWVNSAQFSPDGKTIVTASDDYSAKVWDANTGEELEALKGHFEGVYSTQFSPDGKTIVTASRDHTAKVWDATTGKELHALEGHSLGVESAQFSPDGKTIVTASWDNTAKVWDATTGKELHELEGHLDEVKSAQFSPDGKTIVTASRDHTAKVWDANTGKELLALEGPRSHNIRGAQFSLSGMTILTAHYDSTIKVWDATTGKELHTLEGRSDWFYPGQFSPDGKTIVAPSEYYTAHPLFPYAKAIQIGAKVWDANTGQELLALEGHSDDVKFAQFSPDGKTIVTASDDKTAKVWDANTGQEIFALEGHSNGVNSAQFSPDGKTIVTVSRDRTTKIWDAETGTLLYTRLMLRDGGWLAWDPEYRFDGSSNAIDLLHFACGLEVIELSQAKEPLYVPNLVARIMGGEDLSSKPTLESLDLCGRTPIVTPLPGDGRGWQFDVEPRKGGLQYCEVYIDGVRRFDVPVTELELQANGHYLLSVSNEQVAEYAAASETEIVVIAHSEDKLTSRGGNTWVSVSAPRGNQDEAERAFYGLFIGINDYKGKGLRLNYAAADARELGQVIEAAAVGLFGQENTHVTTLLSDNNRGDVVNPPEKQRVLAELASIAERSNAHDILFVHLAGHGTVNENGEFVFLTSEASSLEDGQYTGVTMQEMSDALMGIKASNRVFIFDACHSGEAMQDALGEGQMAFAFTARNTISTEEDMARGKQLERLGDKANMTMLSASASDQAAFELPEIGHGLLTYALLNAIQAHSDILDEGRFLEVKPWIFQAERTVNSRSEGPNRQQAQSYTPHNYPIGEITPDVRVLIQIDEKPVIKSISLRNKIKGIDDLGLGEKIQNNLKSAASRGGVTLFISDSPNGIGIEGKYSPLEDGRLRVYCEFFTASQFLGEAEWIDEPEADWHQLISAWILENVGD